MRLNRSEVEAGGLGGRKREERGEPRGSSLLTTLVMISVVLGFLAGLISYTVSERQAAINHVRRNESLTCAESGLLLARAYFGRNYLSWNNFLSQPSIYNPIQMATWNPTPADPIANPSALRTNHPELFLDVDGDGKADVYIYVRDNQDELPPAPDNPLQDNDQNVIVGAICVSGTMAPRMQPGTPALAPIQLESILSYNAVGSSCTQAWCGRGTANMNTSGN